MLSGESGNVPKTDASIVIFQLTSILYPFHVDHIIARQHGGQTILENLALACLHCNRHKGPNVAGTDPNTRGLVPLFHPRVDLWNEHFEWIGAALSGRTMIGRVTIHVLAINDPDFLAAREALVEERVFTLEKGFASVY